MAGGQTQLTEGLAIVELVQLLADALKPLLCYKVHSVKKHRHGYENVKQTAKLTYLSFLYFLTKNE